MGTSNIKSEKKKDALSTHPPSVTLLERSGITIQADKNKLVGYLSYSPSSAVPVLQAPIILAALKKAGVVYGIDKEKVSSLSGIDGPLKSEVVARGLDPISGGDASIDYTFKKNPYEAVKGVKDSEKFDYREHGELPFVKAGDVVAVLEHEVEPVAGRAITGEEVVADEGDTHALPPGNNVSVKDNQYVAKIDGALRLDKDGRVEVVNKWIVDGDVGMQTGNIRFKGDVEIKGIIEPGFEVHANHVVAKGVEHNSRIVAEGNVEIDGGIQGGRIESGKNVDTRFINNAAVQSRGNVTVKLSIVNSNIRSSGRVQAHTIIGGTVTTLKGLECVNLSSEANRSTVIVGLDPLKQANIGEILKKKIEVEEQVQQIKEKIGPLADDYEKLQLLNAEIGHLLVERDALKQRLEQVSEDDTSSREFFEMRIEELQEEIGPYEEEMITLKEKTVGFEADYSNELADLKRLQLKLDDLEIQQQAVSTEKVTTGTPPRIVIKGKAVAGTRFSSPNARLVTKTDMRRVVIVERKTSKEKRAFIRGDFFLSVDRL